MGPPFSLAPSFAVSVDGGFFAAPWVSWGTKLALSDLRLSEVAGDFSALYRVKQIQNDLQISKVKDLFLFTWTGVMHVNITFIIFCIFQVFYYECGFVLKFSFWKNYL